CPLAARPAVACPTRPAAPTSAIRNLVIVLPFAVVAAAVLSGTTRNSAAGDGGSYNRRGVSRVQIPPASCADAPGLRHSFRKAAIALPPRLSRATTALL